MKSAYHPSMFHAASWIVLTGYAFAITTLLFRTLGDGMYGIWATVATVRVLGTLVDSGLALGVTRDSALGDSASIARIQTTVWLYRWLGIVIVGVGLAFAWVPGVLLRLGPTDFGMSVAATAIVAVDTGVLVALSPIPAIIRGSQRFDILLGGAAIQAAIGLAVVVLAVPVLGLAGAAAALLLARLVGYLAMARWLSSSAPDLLKSRRIGGVTGQILAFARPLWVGAVGTTLALATDVPIVGAFFGAVVAGQYAVGAMVPSVAIAAIWIVVDTRFPNLSRLGNTSATELIRSLTLAGGILVGTALPLVVFAGDALLRVWLGQATVLSHQVMVIHMAAWAINLPAHVLSLAAVANNRHHILAWVVMGEAVANVALSLALIPALGALAPAVATLVTLSVSNLLLVPMLLSRQLDQAIAPAFAGAATGLFAGSVSGTAVSAAALIFGLSDVWRLAMSFAFAGVAAVGLLQLSRYAVVLQRFSSVAFLGGWRVLVEEAVERRRAGPAIRKMQRTPILWMQSAPPLVTVRIATYNRGPLVAERAIASATAQTHKQLEIFVVGDACNDVTAAAVRRVQDRRVRFVNLPKRGIYPKDSYFRWMVAGAAPMNYALDNAAGEWIAPLDDDDEFTPDHVDALLDACRGSSADFAYGIADCEQRDGSWHPIGEWPPRRGGIIHASVLYDARLRFFPHSYTSWRLDEPGDWNLWRRMRASGVKMTFLARVVVRHYAERVQISNGV